MKGIESMIPMWGTESARNIQELTQCLVSRVNPIKVILFGSFASGTYTDENDYDFYVVVDDGRNVSEVTDEAYNSVLFAKKRPVDIIVGTNSYFERKGKSKHSLMVESEVQRNGILLYDRTATYAGLSRHEWI